MDKIKEIWKNTSKWKIASVVIIALFLFNACSPSKKEEVEAKKSIPSEYVQVPSTSYKSKEQVKAEFDQAGLKVKFVVRNFDSESEKAEEKLIVGTTAPIDTNQPNIKYFDPFKYEYDDNGNLGSFSKKDSELIVVYSDHAYTPKSMKTEETKKETATSSSTKPESNKTKESSSKVEESEPKEDKWYTDDSKYATLPSLKKTVQLQMEELGTDDPIYAIIVNDLQTYLSYVAEYDVKEISNELTYDRDGLAIVLKMDGEKLSSEITDKLSENIKNISGKYYTFL